MVIAIIQKCAHYVPKNKDGYQLLKSVAEDTGTGNVTSTNESESDTENEQKQPLQPATGDTKNETWKDNQHYYYLTMTGLCLLFSILLHSPHIVTAYLNDAQHAGSIFIFYTILTFIEFGLLQFSFNRCLEVYDDLSNQENEGSQIRKIMTMICGIISATFTPLLLYGLTIVIMLYFYFVPTNDSISSVPNQMVVSYQTAILLVGAYIAYTSVFKKKCSLQTALRDTHGNWKLLTDQEVLTEFYKEMISKSDEIASKQKEIALQNKIIILWRKYDHEPDVSKQKEICTKIIKLEREINEKNP